MRTYVDSYDVCHCRKCREPSPDFPKEGRSSDLVGLSDVSVAKSSAEVDIEAASLTWPVPERRNSQPKRDVVIQASAASAKSLKPQNLERVPLPRVPMPDRAISGDASRGSICCIFAWRTDFLGVSSPLS